MCYNPSFERNKNPSKPKPIPSISSAWEETHMDDLIFTQLKEEFKKMIEKVMVEERQKYLSEHDDTRANGFYTRSPKTILGQMDLNVPRTRDGNFKTSILPERKRVMFMLDDVIRAMFISGVSARKAGKVIENLIGCSISSQFASQVSDIPKEVIERFKNRRLNDKYPVLYIDATYVPLKRDSVEKEAVYAVLGLRNDGKRNILAYFLPGGSENTYIWREIFENLKSRGLKNIKMIISDDLKGLSKAIKESFPQAKHQLCWFHLKKNIKSRVRKNHWDSLLNELNQIMEAENQEEAISLMNRFIDKWSKLYKSLNNLRDKIKNYTHFANFNGKIRVYFSTTNWMERCFKELKDFLRIRGYLHSEGSAEKFLYLFFKDKDEKYSSRKLRYSELLLEAFR